MKYRNVMSRRSFLRGAGTVAIALPFLDTMMASSAWAATPNPPDRLITFFFGLGVPREYTTDGFTGALEPLGEFSDKLSLFRNISLAEADGGGNNHFDGGGGVFVGFEPDGEVNAGGPSIDQIVKEQIYPGGVPTALQTLLMGSFFRRTRDGGLSTTRFVHSWRDDGTPVDLPLETPMELFERLFGEDPDLPDVDNEKRARYQQSILDSVVKQYQYVQSERSPFGPRAKAKIADHLERIRELEQRAMAEEMLREQACMIPDAPGTLPLLNGQEKDIGSLGPQLQVADWERVWRLNAEIYAMALRCDLVRFGNAMFGSAGERVRLQGDYMYDGNVYASFDDDEATHEYWHRYSAGESTTNNDWMARHIHFMMNQVAYFLRQLDDDEYLDENGQTILDNAGIVISTELGNGARHDLQSVFHAVSGANDRFVTGQVFEDDASGVDLYNTILRGYGIDDVDMGDASFFDGTVDTMLNNPYRYSPT
jgi:hypothetical protein